jgi:hypothetical protein
LFFFFFSVQVFVINTNGNPAVSIIYGGTGTPVISWSQGQTLNGACGCAVVNGILFVSTYYSTTITPFVVSTGNYLSTSQFLVTGNPGTDSVYGMGSNKLNGKLYFGIVSCFY